LITMLCYKKVMILMMTTYRSGLEELTLVRVPSSTRFFHTKQLAEAVSPEDLWALLKPEEREKFIKALNDPSGELAQQLLASEEIYRDRREPWWEASLGKDGSSQVFGAEPEIMTIPTSMIKPVPIGPPLIYNLFAIWCACLDCPGLLDL